MTTSLTRNSFQDSVFLMLNLVFSTDVLLKTDGFCHMTTSTLEGRLGEVNGFSAAFTHFHHQKSQSNLTWKRRQTFPSVRLSYTCIFYISPSVKVAFSATHFFRIKGNLRDIHLVGNVVQNKLSIWSSHENDWIWFHQNKSACWQRCTSVCVSFISVVPQLVWHAWFV